MKGQKGFAIAHRSPAQGMNPRALIGKAWGHIKRWHQLAEQRRRLATLNDEALKDLGLSRADVLEESERPFWDDPLADSPESRARGRLHAGEGQAGQCLCR
ncbi:DUF1127 domain-containing protein [Pseudomonas benzenivorans]|uniref:DUF1127 domain-containing protein n=1 Tax=Pseudomonas benzenivorans TaxID=556533 RepID=A0ABY5H804_9PSED|nr:DUF1127 domain-containing protein [Pseudomonas benzenivorans]UTW08258.1 DUF1127 domain-containing protein [Pseudomonas benzenivorans]